MMVWRLPILASLAAAQSCRPHIQLLHVQQATSDWGKAVGSMKPSIEKMINEVKGDFSEFDYAMAIFSDKPAPIVGNGSQWGIWKGDSSVTDSTCYKRLSKFSDQVPTINSVVTGNDSDQNPWDAMYRGAKDGGLGWNMEDGTPDQPVIRAIVVVTSDFSHLPGNDDDYDEGYGLNSSYKSLNGHYNANFDKYDDYYSYNQMIWSDFVGSTSDWTGTYERENIPGCKQYEAYLMCVDRENVVDADSKKFSKSMNELFPGKFNETYVSGDWDDFCKEMDADPATIMKWKNDFELLKSSAINDYDYGNPEHDCSKHEYPDPSSEKFIEALQPFYAGVMPMPTRNHLDSPRIDYNMHVHCFEKYTAGDVDEATVGACMLDHYNSRLDKLKKRLTMDRATVQDTNSKDVAAQLEGIIKALKEMACDNPPTTTPTTSPAVTATLGHYKTRGWARVWPIITIILASLAVILLVAWACQCCHFYGCCCCKKSTKAETPRQQETVAPVAQPTRVSVAESVGATSEHLQPSKSSSAIFKQSDKDLEEAHGS